MAANFESGFFGNRQAAWHGMGTVIEGTASSEEAIRLAGLAWDVVPQPLFLADGTEIKDAKANVRSSDNKVLGVVGNRYQIVQNLDAFSFTDSLLGEGVKYETAGSLNGGKRIWLLAILPEKYKILGDEVAPYVVFTNTHDGTGSIKVAMTPTRVVCQNTLNMALSNASRTWSTRHTGDIQMKLESAKETLMLADEYMKALNDEMEELHKIKLNDDKVNNIIKFIAPVTDDMTNRQKANAQRVQSDLWFRYYSAPDLKDLDKTAARFIQAAADTASHITPARMTQNYKENFFGKMIDGNQFLDKAMKIVKAA